MVMFDMFVLLVATSVPLQGVLGQSGIYSSIDGSLNNPIDASMGKETTRFARKLNMAFYDDNVGAIDGTLPNPRAISNNLFGVPPFSYNQARVAFMTAAWGKL